MSHTPTTKCACPDCKCDIRSGHDVLKNGKHYCSEACATGHKNGQGCCNNSCQCHG